MTAALSARKLRKADRRQQILLELRIKPHVRLADLAAQFGVTSETIRRDVEDLSKTGQLRRAYGGASAPHPGASGDLDERRRQRIVERRRLGRFAASLVPDNATVMVDAGSTTIEFARSLALAGTRVTAITNSLQIAMTLGQNPAARVLLAPGTYLPEEAAVIGAETIEFVLRYHADICFLGASGLSDAGGVTEAVRGFEGVKRAMLRQCRSSYFLMDASKFGRIDFSAVARADQIGGLITDRAPSSPLSNALREAGVDIFIPPADEG